MTCLACILMVLDKLDDGDDGGVRGRGDDSGATKEKMLRMKFRVFLEVEREKTRKCVKEKCSM